MRYLKLLISFIFILNCKIILINASTLIDKSLKNVNIQNLNNIYDDSTAVIANIFDNFNKVLEFLEFNYNDVNVDGLFGIRIAEGIFLNLAAKQQNNVMDNLSNIYKRLKTLGKNVFDNVIKQTPEYAKNFEILIGKPFSKSTQYQKYKRLDFELLDQIKTQELDTSFNEQLSDNCYSILLNNYNDKENNCQTNAQCLEYYTQPNASGINLLKNLFLVNSMKN